jgi:hypothetical protein
MIQRGSWERTARAARLSDTNNLPPVPWGRRCGAQTCPHEFIVLPVVHGAAGDRCSTLQVGRTSLKVTAARFRALCRCT